MSEHVRVEKQGAVLAVTLARPDRRNAITVAMYAALADAVEQASGDASVRLVTFRGEGQDFAAGNDLADFLDSSARDGGEIAVWRFLRALAACETPLVAAVHGNCVGIGTTMLLHCDLVVAEEGDAILAAVRGSRAGSRGGELAAPAEHGWPAICGAALLLAEPFGVDEALSIGLISHRAAAGALDVALAQIVAQLLAKPPEALRATQRLLRHGHRDEIVERMQLEGSVFAERLQSQEVKEAIGAFFGRKSRA